MPSLRDSKTCWYAHLHLGLTPPGYHLPSLSRLMARGCPPNNHWGSWTHFERLSLAVTAATQTAADA